MCCVCRFRETTFELLGGVTELNFNKLKWGDDGVVQLAVVLPLCAKLTELQLHRWATRARRPWRARSRATAR